MIAGEGNLKVEPEITALIPFIPIMKTEGRPVFI
jgi:hypothetical protein